MSGPADAFGFIPDRERTARIDAAVRRALCDSVDAVLGAAAQFGISWHGDAGAWRAALMAAEGPAPQIWAVYHDMVQASLDENRARVSRLASDLLSRAPGPSIAPGTVVTLGVAHLGGDAARMAAVIDNDPDRPLGLRPVDEAEVARIRSLTGAARALLAEADPSLADEIDVLGRMMVIATGSTNGFGGAASVFAWGAVMLNPAPILDRVSLAEALAHETAHALLFGLTLGADLTLNDPDERYGSPLRRDARPIEGVVHAVYVLARMTYALTRIERLAILSPAERGVIADKLSRNKAQYGEGLEIVDRHARLTSEGSLIMESCRRFMNEG